MSNNKRKGRAYRIIVITVAFALLGMALFLPLMMSGGDKNWVLIYTIFGVYIAAYVGTVVVNEIVIYKRTKKDNG